MTVIGLDIDGVLAELPESKKNRHRLFTAKAVLDRKPVQGAIEGVKELIRRHTISTCTKRPLNISRNTLHWLEVTFGDVFYHSAFCAEYVLGKPVFRPKPTIYRTLGVEAVVEDTISEANACAEAGFYCVLLDVQQKLSNSIHQAHKSIVYATSWTAVVSELS